MASLSQALRLGDLPPPHRTFQGHATHIREWSMMLRPNDSWSTCIPEGIDERSHVELAYHPQHQRQMGYGPHLMNRHRHEASLLQVFLGFIIAAVTVTTEA